MVFCLFSKEATQSTEYKLFQKTAKMCRFFANTLVHYIKEFKCFLTKYCNCYHQLYLQIISKFPPSLCAPTLPSALSGELKAAALVPMDALLLQLLPLRPFVEFVLQKELRLTPDHQLPQCLMLVSVLGQLASQPEEVLQLWFTGSHFSEDTPRLPLHQALFTSFRRCCTERRVPVLLPGVMMKGQAQVLVTLHTHMCVQLCASVAALPPVYFPVLVRPTHTHTHTHNHIHCIRSSIRRSEHCFASKVQAAFNRECFDSGITPPPQLRSD
ncbi:hypothetical protein EYF80_029027 [Liparis tanakae]|uniref:Uncharacterized protein n=1 Tax=Liparis tanakae TaxID=230148 RepID=A0A4Z2H6P0_9TELE|nr:hypothetical protein EYF80_029027 [Liparis tanakae]